MNIRLQLERKIEAQEKEIDALRAEILKKDSFLQGLKEALKLLPRQEGESATHILRSGSDMAKAKDFLQKLGRPVHIGEILKGIGKEVNKNNRASLSGSIGTYARRGEVFFKSGPNIFGLIEHRGKDAFEDEEPPDDFGVGDAVLVGKE